VRLVSSWVLAWLLAHCEQSGTSCEHLHPHCSIMVVHWCWTIPQDVGLTCSGWSWLGALLFGPFPKL
jgi:hypothetical protein